MLRKHLVGLMTALILALVFFGVAILVMNANGFSVFDTLRDPAQLRGASSFLGFLSNVGVWFWVSASAIYFFSHAQLVGKAAGRSKELILLLGLLSLLLATDDFFMIHDRFVNEYLMYLLYMFLAGFIFIRHHRLLMPVRNMAFFVAIGFMGGSVLIDICQYRLDNLIPGSVRIVAEDGCKFIGSAMWLYFAGRSCGHVLMSVQSEHAV